MASFPLLSHASPDAILAYRGGRPISVRRFLIDVRALSRRLPAGEHVLNVCSDRYRFAVGLAAALLTNRISLLPSTHTPAVIRELKRFAADAFCLTDDTACPIELPQLVFRDRQPSVDDEPEHTGMLGIPQLDGEQIAAYVFTSGSTGAPVPHKKTWARLVRCVRAGAGRLGLVDGRSHALIGTVPSQHMYGFESSVLLAFQSANALCAERPFYPADICSAIAAVARPRVLISTPIHLRTLIAAEIDLPAIDLIVSATAPLSQNLAREVEERFDTKLLEIYGSTETGQIATRRTALNIEWQLLPDVSLTVSGDRACALGGHVEQPMSLCDVLEIVGGDRFLLHGRTADLVNIAGKRSSIAYLNHHLNAIPGVVDGAFFIRDEESHSSMGVTRLAALVVAPQLDAASLMAQLRECIDMVFLPRPLLFVDRLPRNATGKLPHEALRTLLAQHQNSAVCG